MTIPRIVRPPVAIGRHIRRWPKLRRSGALFAGRSTGLAFRLLDELVQFAAVRWIRGGLRGACCAAEGERG
jgi:hypothetical protein